MPGSWFDMAKKRQYGFDLTDFGDEKTFKKVLKKNNLSIKSKKECEQTDIGTYCKFRWKNKKLELITGCEPIKGECRGPYHRKVDKGYTSYIGIEGEEKAVEKLAADINKHAIWIKGQNRRGREFI